jgi:hypothetical protein
LLTTAINLKAAVEFFNTHGNPINTGTERTPTRQAGNYNAQSKYDGGFAIVLGHMIVGFLKYVWK